MPNFEPPNTLAELDELDAADIVEGYTSAERGDPEPGPNRGRAFWFGWRNRMMDLGQIPIDAAHMALCKELVARNRKKFVPQQQRPLP
jgi:hypothetical protein